jgi:uncharacterized membrane-anchored protein
MRVKFIALICLQAALLAGIIGYREYWIETGDKVVLKTSPVDPRDIFRGDYVNLTYQITNMDIAGDMQKPDFVQGQPIYVNLEPSSDGTAVACSVSKEEPAGGRFIQGTILNERIESTWDVTYRDDSGAISKFQPQWSPGVKKGDRIVLCLDKEGKVLLYEKLEQSYNRLCAQTAQSARGQIEEVVETRRKKVNVEYGIESYFVEEGKGLPIEQGRSGHGPLCVEIALRKDGKGIISRLMPEGK